MTATFTAIPQRILTVEVLGTSVSNGALVVSDVGDIFCFQYTSQPTQPVCSDSYNINTPVLLHAYTGIQGEPPNHIFFTGWTV